MIQIIQKPFLKWIGGKTQIINRIVKNVPTEIENYHEPFLGGGSVLLAVLSLSNVITVKQKVYAYDLNAELINLYKKIQNNHQELFERLTHYILEYDSLSHLKNVERKPTCIAEAHTSKESYYYWIRNKFNKVVERHTTESAALFLFLNKTCFRGMYRESIKGFNVPYGHYKKTPTFLKIHELLQINNLIKDVVFIHASFNESFQNFKKGDFIYLDPPYAPKQKNSFVGYNPSGFCMDTQKSLFQKIVMLKEKKIKFIMSNSNVDIVTKTFQKDDGYHYEYLITKSTINSKNPGETSTEFLISNF
jgi:DNA adenine methylase